MGHGELREAAGFHLLGPVTFVAAVAVVAAGDERAGRLLEPDRRMQAVLVGLVGAWLAAWAWRLVRGDE